MKRKVLISSGNAALLSDFFTSTLRDVSLLSTSEYWEDVKEHIMLWSPDVYICMIDKKSSPQFEIIKNMSEGSMTSQVAVVIIANDEMQQYINVGLYSNILAVLKKSLSISGILDYIAGLLEQRDKQKAVEDEFINKKLEEELYLKQLEERAAQEEKNRVRNILVVDDDTNVLKLLRNILSDKYNVATMINGKMATKYLETRPCDLILLDYEMPGETGPEVFRKIKSMDKAKDIPILFLTGVAEKAKIAEVLMLKPQGYLLKPIDTDKLIAAIKNNIG